MFIDLTAPIDWNFSTKLIVNVIHILSGILLTWNHIIAWKMDPGFVPMHLKESKYDIL